MRGFFRPLGRTLLLETDSEAILALAEDTFGRFGPAGPVETPDVVLRLTGTAVDNPATFRSEVLLYGFLSQLSRHGLLAAHGSAVVRDGRAILLRGPSGSGKTTLAYAAARSRFQALAEDVAWMDLRAGLWRGIPWFFHLLPDAPRLFPELAGLPAAPGSAALESAGKMKLEVDLESIRPGSAVPEALPGPVVLLERAARNDLERLGPAEALDLWRRCPAGTEESFPGYDRHVEEILKDGAWRLRLGTDLEGAIDLLETLPR